jgi:hypothetical protein
MHWPDMIRVAGSLITNPVRAYVLLRMFGREGHPTPLGAAFAEYGRIDKTIHLLAMVDPVDNIYRRLMNRQLTASAAVPDVLMSRSDSGAASRQYRRSKVSTRLRSSRDRRRDIASITASRNSRACHGSPQQAHSVQPPLSYSHNRRFGWWTKLRQRTIADPIEPGHRYFF